MPSTVGPISPFPITLIPATIDSEMKENNESSLVAAMTLTRISPIEAALKHPRVLSVELGHPAADEKFSDGSIS